MVTEFFLDLIEEVIAWIISLLPTAGQNWIDSSWGQVMTALSAANYYLPLSELAVAVLGAFAIFPILLVVSLVIWIVALIRGGSARG